MWRSICKINQVLFLQTPLPPPHISPLHLPPPSPGCFSQIPSYTPFNAPSHNSTAPHSSQKKKKKKNPLTGASQVCTRARACDVSCECILHGWRIDGIHKVKQTSRTTAAWQGEKERERDSTFIIFMCSSNRSPARTSLNYNTL